MHFYETAGFFGILAAIAVSADEAADFSLDDINKNPKLYWGEDTAYSGITTFAHLDHVRCLVDVEADFDIAILGFPFDTAVSYRTGARFGPRHIRANSMRQAAGKAFNVPLGIDPFTSWAKIVDCGDIPISAYDNEVAIKQMNLAYGSLLKRRPTHYDKKSHKYPKIISLGGDHSIAYPILRQLKEVYGPISVIHFDSHIDTWSPVRYSGPWASKQSQFTHGSMFHLAAIDGAIANSTSIHAGLRTRLSGLEDYEHDEVVGFKFVEAREIDDIGVEGVIRRIRTTVGTERPCYLSIDIDVVDPGLAPGTGTPEIGGWTTREMKKIIQGLKDLNLVGADIVEVSPAYDNEAETTALAAADFVFEILGIMVSSKQYRPIEGYKDPTFWKQQSILPRDEL